jgi:hypothetical protein
VHGVPLNDKNVNVSVTVKLHFGSTKKLVNLRSGQIVAMKVKNQFGAIFPFQKENGRQAG